MPDEPIELVEVAEELRAGRRDLAGYLNTLCDRIDAREPDLQALLPEPDRRARLLAEAAVLRERGQGSGVGGQGSGAVVTPDPSRPLTPDPRPLTPLFGIPVGIKDIIHVDGFVTRAGSRLPPELFAGAEASCVAKLRRAGALVLGKTVTTEFADGTPGPTRNPHRPAHTPGGSSSGSAAAVAAGYCPLALGTQTTGSVIRPAAFCGVAGFKPTFGRIPIDGVIHFAPSLDTLGLFARDARGLALGAAILCDAWQPAPEEPETGALPTLGVPDGPYLAQALPEALEAFERQVRVLEEAGYPVRRVAALEDIGAIARRHHRLAAAEVAQVHASWFAAYEPLYHSRLATSIRDGATVSAQEVAAARAGQAALRQELQEMMAAQGIRAWICPAATGPAPEGLASTGNPAMNLPWTHTGLPAVTLPAGVAPNGLPLGLQCVGAAMEDERLLALAARIEPCLRKCASPPWSG